MNRRSVPGTRHSDLNRERESKGIRARVGLHDSTTGKEKGKGGNGTGKKWDKLGREGDETTREPEWVRGSPIAPLDYWSLARVTRRIVGIRSAEPSFPRMAANPNPINKNDARKPSSPAGTPSSSM